jgi:putative (di)nucleoside polyphosphate hydrolase
MDEAAIKALPYRPCVGVMIINDAGHIWSGRRIDNAANAWQMPQGGVDPGEALLDAAYREMGEETAIPKENTELLAAMETPLKYDLPYDLVPKLWKGRFRGQEQRWFLMHFKGPDSLINIETEEPEFSHWQWMPYGSLIESIVPFKRDVYEAVWTEFGPLVEAMRV